MATSNPELRVCAVVATKGRSSELEGLFESLRAQTRSFDEVLLVDQNPDDRLASVIASNPDIPVTHIHDPSLNGLNRSRNAGWRATDADIVIFSDDDCWYPVDFLEKALGIFDATGADIVSGRATDEVDGRSINGRFLDHPCEVDRTSAWFTQIEWMVLMKREVLTRIEGFDDAMGVGSGTDWGSGEAQDLTLRALDAGFRQVYDPSLVGHHAEFDTSRLDDAGYARAGQYAQGVGYVLVKHGYGLKGALYWTLRPLAGALVALFTGKLGLARYRFVVGLGRLRGYHKARRHFATAQ